MAMFFKQIDNFTGIKYKHTFLPKFSNIWNQIFNLPAGFALQCEYEIDDSAIVVLFIAFYRQIADGFLLISFRND